MSMQQFEILNRSIVRPAAALEKWTTPSALFYIVTVFSTIGYGTFAPTSDFGKLYTCVLAIVGVVHFGYFLTIVSTNINHLLATTIQKARCLVHLTRGRCSRAHVAVSTSAMATFIFLILVSFIGIGGSAWGYGNGFYYSMITFSTIGLGDYAPDVSQVESSSTRLLLAVLLTIGLSGGLALFGIVVGAVAKAMNGAKHHGSVASAAGLSPSAGDNRARGQMPDLETLGTIAEAVKAEGGRSKSRINGSKSKASAPSWLETKLNPLRLPPEGSQPPNSKSNGNAKRGRRYSAASTARI